MSQKVVPDDPAVGGKRLYHWVPHGVVEAHSVDQDERWTGAGLDAVDADEGLDAHSSVSPISSMSE